MEIGVGEELRISDVEISQVLSVGDFLESCDEAFRLYGLGKMRNLPRREDVREEGGMDLFRLELPGEWPGISRTETPAAISSPC